MDNESLQHRHDLDAATVACQLDVALQARGVEHAFGGAIALGFWGAPRGTIDVDVTLFLAPEKPSECLYVLQEIGCQVTTSESLESLREHGFCRVSYLGLDVDVFLPTIPFYEEARARRQRVPLGEVAIPVWDAESLVVFKMMFFRRKDVADVEQILRTQGPRLDREWILERLSALYGNRDPRVTQWIELVEEIPR